MLTNSIILAINGHDTLKPLKHPISPSQILNVTLNAIKMVQWGSIGYLE
jgi:hypothetical protein